MKSIEFITFKIHYITPYSFQVEETPEIIDNIFTIFPQNFNYFQIKLKQFWEDTVLVKPNYINIEANG